MLGGAFGSFAFSTATGQNNAHFLHKILYFGNDNDAEVHTTIDRKQYLKELEERKIQRRKTMKHQLEEGHGISDSHGGHWVDEKAIMKEQLQGRRS